jgi:UDP-glucose 4-epimerase
MVLGRVGLTGCTGMLGRHLHAAFHSAGVEVIPVSRTSKKGVTGWDLTKWLQDEEFDRLFSGVSAIVHAGAHVQTSPEVNYTSMYDANVRACLNLGQWALSRDIPFVHISGAIVYADPTIPMQNELARLGYSRLGGFYGFSKLLAEDILLRLRQQGLKLALLRPTSIYGHGMNEAKTVRRFLTKAIKNGVIELIEPIEDRIDLLHAADVARAVLAVLRAKLWDTLNLASGEPTSFKDLAEACIKISGRGKICILGNTLCEYRPKVTYSLDITRAKEYLGWTPMIGINRGLNMMLNSQYLADE